MSASENNLSGEFTPQQREAITTRGNVLVVAGAGTGKTRTLIARCLRLVVEEGASLENMLLVTFTQAAAAEMRARLRRELRELLAGRPDDPHLAQQLALLDVARISTLHSFCLQLAREHFHTLGLDPQFGILDAQQTRPLIRAALDEVLERHYTGTNAAARAVQALVRVIGRGTDAGLRKLVGKIHAYSQSLPDPEGWLDEQQRRFEQSEPEEWRQWFAVAVAAWRDEWLEFLSLLASAAPAVQLCHEALKRIPATPSSADAAEALRAVRSADADEGLWPRGTKTKVRNRLKRFFRDAEFLGTLLPDERGEPLAQDWAWSRSHLATLVSLTREFASAFGRAKRDLGGLDFADLEQCTLRVLRDPACAATWRERLTHVFVDEYQDINDAQDTIIQALCRVPSGARLAHGIGADSFEGGTPGGGNRFMVGDVKQSIYRFRRANPKIFSGYDECWSKPGGDGRRIPLTENFRSRAGLLDFINPLFAALMRPELGGVAYEPLKFGAPERRTALAAKTGDPPRVEFHLIARGAAEAVETDAEAEAEPGKTVPDLLAIEYEARLLARRLRELKEDGHEIWDEREQKFRPVRWSDMAVLLRSPSGRVEAFAKEFSNAGVPLAAARDGFFESLEISDLVNLLKLLDNPLQDVPLLSVLRSPLVGLSLDELALLRADNREKHFWTAMRRWCEGGRTNGRGLGSALSNASQVLEKLEFFLARHEEWRRIARQNSISGCLDAVVSETYFEALLLAGSRGDERVANVRRLLDLARKFDPYQRQGLSRFLRFVAEQQDEEAELAPSIAVADAVQLMSIHKSKGLEFPAVALAGLGTRFNERDLSEPVLMDEDYGLCARILPPEREQNYPGLSYWLARRAGRMGLRGEELRLLYVALTRARDTFVLVGSLNRKADEARWKPVDDWDLNAPEVTAAGSQLDWLLAWLPHATSDADWHDDRRGENRILRWEIHDAKDSLFSGHASKGSSDSSSKCSLAQNEIASCDQIRAKLSWRYRYVASTAEAAKTSVTALRKRSRDETVEEAQALFRFGAPKQVARRDGDLTAVEIGNAHHLFLQRASLDRMNDEKALKRETTRLYEEGLLTLEQLAALDLVAIGAFWQSDEGKRILARREFVQREIPFTARFSQEELRSCGISMNGMAEEFIVVQGIADLAVILPDRIQLVDFKTDDVWGEELVAKAELYGPQLKIYAHAFGRIYRRPVTECRLYFLLPRAGILVAPE